MSAQPRERSQGTSDWRTRWAPPTRHVHDSETRPYFETSEYLLLVLLIMGSDKKRLS